MRRAEERRQRARTRQSKHLKRLRAQAGEMTVLELASVRRSTQEDYLRRLNAFYDFAAFHLLSLKSLEDLDKALVDYSDTMYLNGEDSHAGDKLKAALEFQRPEGVRTGRLELPRFKRALKGWRKLAPTQVRQPMLEFLKSAVSGVLLRMGKKNMALFNEATFSTYARPGELLRVFPADIVPKNDTFGYDVIILGAMERGIASKAGIYDETLILDDKRVPWHYQSWTHWQNWDHWRPTSASEDQAKDDPATEAQSARVEPSADQAPVAPGPDDEASATDDAEHAAYDVENESDDDDIVAEPHPWRLDQQRLPVEDLRWAQDTIGIRFRDGTYLVEALKEMLEGRLQPSDLPTFRVVLYEDQLFAVTGNRRLWVEDEMAERALFKLLHPDGKSPPPSEFAATDASRQAAQEQLCFVAGQRHLFWAAEQLRSQAQRLNDAGARHQVVAASELMKLSAAMHQVAETFPVDENSGNACVKAAEEIEFCVEQLQWIDCPLELAFRPPWLERARKRDRKRNVAQRHHRSWAPLWGA
eukprot:g3173.t1